jgi:hypothetical protein
MYYSVRLIILVFLDNYNGFRYIIKNHTKLTNLEVFLLGFLGFLSIMSGYYFKDVFVGLGANYFGVTIHEIPSS